MLKKVAPILLAAVLICTTAFAEFIPQIDIDDGEQMYAFYETLLRVTERGYRFDITKEQLLEAAIKEVLIKHPELFDTLAKGTYSILDENSRYLSYEEYGSVAEKVQGEFEGIGINLMEYGGITIIGDPITGSPAHFAGVMAGDVIVSVDDIDIKGYVLDQTVKLIRGEVGTFVKLGIERGGRHLTFNIKRDVIKINPVSYEVLSDIRAAYVRIETFNAYTSVFLEEALREVAKQGIYNIILDLRYNLGGLLAEAINVASFFLPGNTLVVTEDFKDESKNKSYYSLPTDIKFQATVLINEYSASASEIVAAAIKENKQGVLIGNTTFGKGTVQQTIQMKNGGAMWLTIAKYLTPSGSYIHGLGISPDHYIENKNVLLDTAEFEPVKGERVLSTGDNGIDVLAIKQRLAGMGYPIDLMDGLFDSQTEAAVYAFQNSNGLFPYGVADITTQIKIMDVAFETEVVQDKQMEKAKEIAAELSPDNVIKSQP